MLPQLNGDKKDEMAFLASIIQKENKSNTEIDLIRNYLLRIPFFQQLLNDFKDQDDLIYQFCDKIKFVEIPPRTVIIKQGSKTATELFILIKGSINVLQRDIPLNQDLMPLEELLYYEGNHIFQQDKTEIFHNPQIPLEQEEETKLWKIVQIYYGEIKSEINRPGILIGEKALLESKSRAATIITKETSQFFILHREDFNSVKQAFQIQEKEKRELLTVIFPNIFGSEEYTKIFKERIYRVFYDQKAYKDQIIISPDMKQNNDNPLYIVLRGDFQVEIFIYERHLKNNYDYQDPNQFILKAIKGTYKKFCLISVGSIIGEEIEFVNHYLYRVKCLSSQGFLMKFYLPEIKKYFGIEKMDILLKEYNKKINQQKIHKLTTPSNQSTNTVNYLNDSNQKINQKQKLFKILDRNSPFKGINLQESFIVQQENKDLKTLGHLSNSHQIRQGNSFSPTLTSFRYKSSSYDRNRSQEGTDQQNRSFQETLNPQEKVSRFKSYYQKITQILNKNLVKTHYYLNRMNMFGVTLRTPLNIGKQIIYSSLSKKEKQLYNSREAEALEEKGQNLSKGKNLIEFQMFNKSRFKTEKVQMIENQIQISTHFSSKAEKAAFSPSLIKQQKYDETKTNLRIQLKQMNKIIQVIDTSKKKKKQKQK